MDEVNNLDIWRIIPPEEKLEMMAKAHARGIMSAGTTLIIGGTCAVGLQFPWILWGTFILVPFVFQFASNKAWRNFKPSAVLRYLAARSAARRYAFTTRATDLDCTLMFKGTLEQIFSDDDVHGALEAVVAKTKSIDVWVALFRDAIVLMSERPGGAKLELGHLINDKLQVEIRSESGEDYAPDTELAISFPKDNALESLIETAVAEKVEYKLSSKYPAALVVFQKKIDEYRKRVKQVAHEALALAMKDKDDDDDLFSGE